jgi:hypothetical protein
MDFSRWLQRQPMFMAARLSQTEVYATSIHDSRFTIYGIARCRIVTA